MFYKAFLTMECFKASESGKIVFLSGKSPAFVGF